MLTHPLSFSDIYVRYDDEPRTLRLLTVKTPEWVINQINYLRRQHWETTSTMASNPGSGLIANNNLILHEEDDDYM